MVQNRRGSSVDRQCREAWGTYGKSMPPSNSTALATLTAQRSTEELSRCAKNRGRSSSRDECSQASHTRHRQAALSRSPEGKRANRRRTSACHASITPPKSQALACSPDCGFQAANGYQFEIIRNQEVASHTSFCSKTAKCQFDIPDLLEVTRQEFQRAQKNLWMEQKNVKASGGQGCSAERRKSSVNDRRNACCLATTSDKQRTTNGTLTNAAERMPCRTARRTSNGLADNFATVPERGRGAKKLGNAPVVASLEELVGRGIAATAAVDIDLLAPAASFHKSSLSRCSGAAESSYPTEQQQESPTAFCAWVEAGLPKSNLCGLDVPLARDGSKESPSKDRLNSMKLAELKRHCKDEKLPHSGCKAALVDRLIAHYKATKSSISKCIPHKQENVNGRISLPGAEMPKGQHPVLQRPLSKGPADDAVRRLLSSFGQAAGVDCGGTIIQSEQKEYVHSRDASPLAKRPQDQLAAPRRRLSKGPDGNRNSMQTGHGCCADLASRHAQTPEGQRVAPHCRLSRGPGGASPCVETPEREQPLLRRRLSKGPGDATPCVGTPEGDRPLPRRRLSKGPGDATPCVGTPGGEEPLPRRRLSKGPGEGPVAGTSSRAASVDCCRSHMQTKQRNHMEHTSTLAQKPAPTRSLSTGIEAEPKKYQRLKKLDQRLDEHGLQHSQIAKQNPTNATKILAELGLQHGQKGKQIVRPLSELNGRCARTADAPASSKPSFAPSSGRLIGHVLPALQAPTPARRRRFEELSGGEEAQQPLAKMAKHSARNGLSPKTVATAATRKSIVVEAKSRRRSRSRSVGIR